MANPRRTAVNSATGTFAAGPLNAAKSMAALETTRIVPGSLSAKVYWSAYTDLITLTGKWQGSADNTTWVDYVPTNNAAHVVLQTNTGSGTKLIPAPTCIQGLPYVRFSLVSGAASGSSGDAYTMSYNYRAGSPFDGGVYNV
jgi:hypothetical protein